jgi:hypothetical protein
VKYNSKNNQIYVSKEFSISRKDAYMLQNRSKELREVYLLLVCVVEQAMEEFTMNTIVRKTRNLCL